MSTSATARRLGRFGARGDRAELFADIDLTPSQRPSIFNDTRKARRMGSNPGPRWLAADFRRSITQIGRPVTVERLAGLSPQTVAVIGAAQ